jgi:transposase
MLVRAIMLGFGSIPGELEMSGSGYLEMSEPVLSQPAGASQGFVSSDTSAVGVMSAKELDRLRVIRLVLERRLTRVKAGELLRITARHVARLCGAYERNGAAGLISRKRGRVGNRKLPSDVEAQVVELARQFYRDLGPTVVREKLAERHGIKLAKETVRKILSKAGLWSPKKIRPSSTGDHSAETL